MLIACIYCCGFATPSKIRIFNVPVWFWGFSLVDPRLPVLNHCFSFRASLEDHANHAHCLAAAVNTVLCAQFALSGRRDTEERLKEFLAVR